MQNCALSIVVCHLERSERSLATLGMTPFCVSPDLAVLEGIMSIEQNDNNNFTYPVYFRTYAKRCHPERSEGSLAALEMTPLKT